MTRKTLYLCLFALGSQSVSATSIQWQQWPVSQGGNGHYYGITGQKYHWQHAELLADGMQGHLASITSAEEQQFINKYLLTGVHEHGPLWIGLSDSKTEGVFSWSSGEPVTFTNWKANEPNNIGGEEHFVATNWDYARNNGFKGSWNDTPLLGTIGYGGNTDGPYYGLIEIDTNATVDTVAGIDTSGYSGDGGPALDAEIYGPSGMAIDSQDNIYFIDQGAVGGTVVRRIDAKTGIITTVAGNGLRAYAGDGGLATDASLNGPVDIAFAPDGDLLILEYKHRLRRVDSDTGIIDTIAGNGIRGYSGDGGPAQNANLNYPEGLFVASDGSIFISDTDNNVVRKIEAATGIITTVIGNGNHTRTGDGGLATSASLVPVRISGDIDGNLYIVDYANPPVIRRVDATTHVISTVAGGGPLIADSGPALSIHLGGYGEVVGGIQDVLVEDSRHLLISTQTRIWRLDLASEYLEAIAGTGEEGFSGDGGDPLLAVFSIIDSIATDSKRNIYLSDAYDPADRIRKIQSGAVSPGSHLIVANDTDQALLDGVISVEGSVLMVDQDVRDSLIVPNLTDVGADVTVSDNDAATSIDLGTMDTAGGNVTVSNNDSATSIDLGSLTSTGGSVTVSDNDSATSIDLGSLTSADGDVTVSDNDAATSIDLGSLDNTGGSVTVSDNDAATSIDLGSLTSTGGNLTVSDNDSATSIDLGSLTSTGGNLTVSDNDSATSIDLGSLTSTGGDLIIAANPLVSDLNVSSLHTVGGSLILETSGQTTLDVSGVTTSGDVILTGGDAEVISGNTGGGSTSVTLLDAEASMQAELPSGTFTSSVPFTIEHLDPSTLTTELGLDAEGNDAWITPVTAYRFSFGVPTLNQDATLTFEVDVGALGTDAQTAFLTSLDANLATVAVLRDTPGSVYQAFAVCDAGETADANGCIEITRLNSEKQPLGGTVAQSAFVRFTGITGHFSTWAVVVQSEFVQARDPGDLDQDGDVDNDDLAYILAARNTLAEGSDDPRDLNGDGSIDLLDARRLVLLCSRPRCATE